MIRIWGRPTSICTMRALWALTEAGLPYELTLASAAMGPQGHVSKGGPAFGLVDTPEYRAMNPNGTIPSIDDDGFVLWESIAIVQYLALKHAPGPLHDGDLRTFARASAWMSWTNEMLEPQLHVLVMELVRLAPERRNAEAREAARQAILEPLAILDAQLARTAWVAGDAFGMGDIPTGCAVQRWLAFDLERPAMPHLEAWQARLAEREGFRRHVLPPEHHIAG
jgi:glutathione S-transferase